MTPHTSVPVVTRFLSSALHFGSVNARSLQIVLSSVPVVLVQDS